MDNIEPILASYENKKDPVPKFEIPKFSKDAWLIAIATLIGAILVCLTILWVSAGTPALFKVTKNDGPKTSDAPQAINSTVLMDDDAILGDNFFFFFFFFYHRLRKNILIPERLNLYIVTSPYRFIRLLNHRQKLQNVRLTRISIGK